MPLLAYLDQTHIGNFTDDQVETLAGFVASGDLIAPISMTHVVETWKQHSIPRAKTVARLKLLGGEFGFPDESTLHALEWVAFCGGTPVSESIRKPGFWGGRPMRDIRSSTRARGAHFLRQPALVSNGCPCGYSCG